MRYCEIEHRVVSGQGIKRVEVYGAPFGRLHAELGKVPFGVAHRGGGETYSPAGVKL